MNSLLVEGQNAQEARKRVQTVFAERGADTIFVDRISDWIDEDNGVTGVGAEDLTISALSAHTERRIK